MRFRASDIRRGMDVYTLDGHFLGTIHRIDATPDHASTPPIDPAAQQSSISDGESRGPVPTQRVGNTGPARQSAREGYGTGSPVSPALGDGTITFGKYHGLIGRRTVPIEAIQNVALERVVLSEVAGRMSH